MKQLFFLCVTCLAISCTTVAQNKDAVEPSGTVVTREINLKPFTKLKASGVYELVLKQGADESIRIEADEALQAYFTIREGVNELEINTEKLKNIRWREGFKMKVYLTYKNLERMDLNMVGNVRSEGSLQFTQLTIDHNGVGNVTLDLKGNELNIENSSVGNITLTGRAQQARFVNSGVGNLRAGDFEVEEAVVDNTGVGNAEINASKKITANDSFLGKVRNRGGATLRTKKKVVI